MFSREDGKPISELQHIYQSMRMILMTPIGSRVMRRDFGSTLPRLIDRPLNTSTITAIYAASNEAIATWEPRVEVIGTKMDLELAKQGIAKLTVIFRLAGESEVLQNEFDIS